MCINNSSGASCCWLCKCALFIIRCSILIITATKLIMINLIRLSFWMHSLIVIIIIAITFIFLNYSSNFSFVWFLILIRIIISSRILECLIISTTLSAWTNIRSIWHISYLLIICIILRLWFIFSSNYILESLDEEWIFAWLDKESKDHW